MPVLPIIADTYRCSYEYASGGATYANVFGINAVGATAQQVADHIKSSVLNATAGSSIQALQSSDISLTKTTALPLDGVSLHAESLFSAGTFGSGASGAVPANAAGIITLNTSARGRSNRGRLYLGGLPKALVDSSGATWGTSWHGDAVSWFGQFITNLSAGSPSCTLCVISIKLGLAPLVTSFTPRVYIGSIRRRTERQE
jgi:hypothetical protein